MVEEENCLSKEQAELVYNAIDDNITLDVNSCHLPVSKGAASLGGTAVDDFADCITPMNDCTDCEYSLNVAFPLEEVEEIMADCMWWDEPERVRESLREDPQTPSEETTHFEVPQSNMTTWSIVTTKPQFHMGENAQDLIKVNPSNDMVRAPDGMKSLGAQLSTSNKKEVEMYLDRHEDVEPVFNLGKTFNVLEEVGVTYLGRRDRLITNPAQPTQAFKINNKAYTPGVLPNGDPLEILIDTGCTSAILTEGFYNSHPELHNLPKFHCPVKNITVGNGETISVKFVIPLQVGIPDWQDKMHDFQIYTMVVQCPPSGYASLVIGMKELHEIEAKLDTTRNEVEFMNRAAPLVPLEECTIPAGQEKLIKLKVDFCQELSGWALCKILLGKVVGTSKMKIHRNMCALLIENHSSNPLKIDTNTFVGIIDTRSIGYFRIPVQALEETLKNHFNFLQVQNLDRAKERLQGSSHQFQRRVPEPKPPDPYPWLDETDPRRQMTDEEILKKFVDLSKSCLTSKEKKEVQKLLTTHKTAFSLRDEIGECPDMRVDIEIVDKTPFFVRPFPIAESDKPHMDRQMQRLVALGILTEQSTACTSPVMLITRKLTQDKRPVVDFRQLNTRILRRNTATPLMRDIFCQLGKSECEVMSCIDLKDAYHSIPLTDKAKEYCGILPYFGSPHYRYEVLPMGLSISPAKWMEYVNILLKELRAPSQYIAIMDDILIHSKKSDHLRRLEELLKAIVKHGLKISPKKCQLFRTELQYMGNKFAIIDQKMTVSALKSRTDAIQNIPQPQTPKALKSFCGVVNYLAMFCPGLQDMLRPLYELTRKGKPWHWTDIHQTAFETIKAKLQNPPVLTCPTAKGRFILYSDTSRQHVGSALWQIQECIPKLVGCASKTLTPAAQNYSVTELEMHGMYKSMEIWQYWLGSQEFDCAVDHKAVVDIMKAKHPPATNRIADLLEKLNKYSFKLYYLKGKDMTISDYLSRLQLDKEPPTDLVPMPFCTRDILETLCKEHGHVLDSSQYCVLTRRKAAEMGERVEEVHGAQKKLDPNLKPEHQKKSKLPQMQDAPVSEAIQRPKSILKRKTPINLLNDTRKRLVKRSINTLNDRNKQSNLPPAHSNDMPSANDIPNEELPNTLPKPPISHQFPKGKDKEQKQVQWDKELEKWQVPTKKPPDIQQSVPFDLSPPKDEGLDLGGPLEDIFALPEYRTPRPEDFAKPPPLENIVDEENLIHKFLPRQKDIDKILNQIKNKVLRQTHLPTDLRDMEAAYLASPHFRDIYLHLKSNKIPKDRKKAKTVASDAQHYLILDSLLFKILEDRYGNVNSVLCIPTAKVEMLLQLYHSSIVGSHAGMTKTALKIKERFYCPGLEQHLRAYITGCHKCQLFKKGKSYNRPFQKRVNIDTPAMQKISIDIKHMPSGLNGFKYILVVLCETTNYIMAIPLRTEQAPEICEALFTQVISVFGSPSHIISDRGPAFTSSLTEYFLSRLGCKQLVISPTNHKSLLAEHGIKSLSNLLLKHLTDLGKEWPNFVKTAQLNHNSYPSPHLDGHSPGELVLGHKIKLIPEIEISFEAPISGSFKDYKGKLDKQIKQLRNKVERFKDQRHDLTNSDKEAHSFQTGEIVYLFHPKGAHLQSGSRKIACQFVGPLVIYKAISPTQFLLMSLDGKLYPQLIEETRLKEGFIRTSMGNAKTLAELKQALLGKLIPTPPV